MKQNSKSPAGTNVQQSDAVEASSVCPTCTKPLVVRSPKGDIMLDGLIRKIQHSKLVLSEKSLLSIRQPSEFLIEIAPLSQDTIPS